ncbi:4Fe-4S dicluster domain-containing protein, partial [Flavobacterium sp.]|uniref:4Fe-4S dicluster domain-containing protein n=1 Tax=Flavobacterium sp. TaxID=239 RepID=UPI002C529E0C
VCIIACPYGRMQGVLLDNKTINVAYDHVRGEGESGRGKFNKNEDRAATGKGDCIDCKVCVHVCPTGIDIRNGTQLECINCTACIDECDSIMEKVGFPKGLIRYASEDEIVKKEKFKLTTRMKGYIAVLAILIGVFIGMLFLRNDVEATVLHMPGQLFQHEGTKITNIYNYTIVNKTTNDFDNVTFKLVEPKGEIKLVGNPFTKVPKQGITKGTFFVKIEEATLNGEKIDLKIEVYNKDKRIESTTTLFVGPRNFN